MGISRAGFLPSTAVGRWRAALIFAAGLLGLLVILQPAPWVVFARVGEEMSIADYATAYTWIAAALGIGILACLVAICPWWAAAPQPVAAEESGWAPAPRWFWPAVLGAVVVAAVLVSPLLVQSVEADECMSLRESILGRYQRLAPDGEVKFKEVSWRTTIYGYREVNNHILASLVARFSNGLWRMVVRPAGLQFNEVALRLPFFLCALGSIVALALLLRASGFPGAGALAAWFLAFHPWFERYAAFARGYGLVFLLLPVVLLAWRQGMLTARWRWWGIFAVGELLILWAYPGMLFLLVLVNVASLALFLCGSGLAQPPRTVVSRWFCSNALAAVAALPLMLPLMPQVRAYFDRMPHALVGGKWAADTLSLLVTGTAWSKRETFPPIYPEVEPLYTAHPLVFALALAALAGLFFYGLIRFVRAGALCSVVAGSWLVAPVLQFFYARHETMYIWEYYVIYAVPLFVSFFALGVTGIGRALQARRPGSTIPAMVAVGALVVFVLGTQRTRAWQASHSRTLLLESTLLTRPNLDPWSDENKRILTVGITSPPLSYDANMIRLESAAELALICRQAEQSQRPLFLNLGHLWIIEEKMPVIARMIKDRSLFSEVRRMEGESPAGDRIVLRYEPGGVERVDWSLYLEPGERAFVESRAGLRPEEYFVLKRSHVP